MTLRGVQFGNYHTANDWNLILHEKDVSPPVPKTNYVSVPGRDGDLDLTEAVSGEVNYQDRKAVYTFLLTDGTHADRVELIAQIIGLLHGRRVRIIDTDDYPDYYMTGRLSVSDVTTNAAYGTLRIEAVCQPWRYAINHKSKTVELEEGAKAQIVVMSNNGYKVVAPTLTVTGSVTLTYGSESTVLDDGTYILPGLRFRPGANTITVKGAGSVTISYQEAIF